MRLLVGLKRILSKEKTKVFNFNYSERRVDRFIDGDLTISTAEVSGGFKPFETAIEHPSYNDGNWVIVEAYNTRDEAQVGHDRWVKIMTIEPLPTKLKGCINELFAKIRDEEDPSTLTFERI
jgi:hypothetical protein